METAPLRRFNHEERVEISRRICGQILNRFKEIILGVFVTGSTAKSLDRPYSDLEMTVIVKDAEKLPTQYYLHNGLLIQIDYRRESEFLKSAREPGREWPIAADESRNRIVLFDRDNWTRNLTDAVAEGDAKDFTDALRFAALEMTESLAAVRNADFKDDLRDLRTRAFFMAWDTGRVVYLLNRKYVLTTSWYWKQLFECPTQPRDLKQLIDVIAGFVPSTRKEIVDGAERLWSETMSLVRARGIIIESDVILV